MFRSLHKAMEGRFILNASTVNAPYLLHANYKRLRPNGMAEVRLAERAWRTSVAWLAEMLASCTTKSRENDRPCDKMFPLTEKTLVRTSALYNYLILLVSVRCISASPPRRSRQRVSRRYRPGDIRRSKTFRVFAQGLIKIPSCFRKYLLLSGS